MPPTSPRPSTSKRAVYTGLAVVAVLTLIGYIAARITGLIVPGFVPAENELLLFVSSIALFMMVGGYVTAKLAPQDPKNHTISLGTILTVIGLVASIALSFANYGPNWFGWLLVLSGLPFAWLGGKFKRERDERKE
jgi:archaellum biogenesis protein FlaJ (TadC family)